jgi:hypothetical protein
MGFEKVPQKQRFHGVSQNVFSVFLRALCVSVVYSIFLPEKNRGIIPLNNNLESRLRIASPELHQVSFNKIIQVAIQHFVSI